MILERQREIERAHEVIDAERDQRRKYQRDQVLKVDLQKRSEWESLKLQAEQAKDR